MTQTANYGETIIVWFCSERMIEILTAPGIDDPRIEEYLRSLLGVRAKVVSDRTDAGNGFGSYCALVPVGMRLDAQTEIAEKLRLLGYKVVAEPFPSA
ncbi:MAG: hypothetical protein WCT39_06185 [Candidatus Margulisiibacteriota bacterium]